jgi:hypothetical protein
VNNNSISSLRFALQSCADADFDALTEAHGAIPERVEFDAKLLRHPAPLVDPRLPGAAVILDQQRALLGIQRVQALLQAGQDARVFIVSSSGSRLQFERHDGDFTRLRPDLQNYQTGYSKRIVVHSLDAFPAFQSPGDPVERLVRAGLGFGTTLPGEELHQTLAQALISLSSHVAAGSEGPQQKLEGLALERPFGALHGHYMYSFAQFEIR